MNRVNTSLEEQTGGWSNVSILTSDELVESPDVLTNDNTGSIVIESMEDGFYTITGHQPLGGGTSWVAYGQAEIQDLTSDSAPSGKDQLYEIEYTWSVTAGVTVIPGLFSGSGTWVSDGVVRTRKLVVTAKQSSGIFGYLGVIYTGGQDNNTKFKFKINSAKKLPCGILDFTDVGIDSNLY